MQMPPVSEGIMENEIFGIHPMLDESKHQLFFVKENTEVTSAYAGDKPEHG